MKAVCPVTLTRTLIFQRSGFFQAVTCYSRHRRTHSKLLPGDLCLRLLVASGRNRSPPQETEWRGSPQTPRIVYLCTCVCNLGIQWDVRRKRFIAQLSELKNNVAQDECVMTSYSKKIGFKATHFSVLLSTQAYSYDCIFGMSFEISDIFNTNFQCLQFVCLLNNQTT